MKKNPAPHLVFLASLLVLAAALVIRGGSAIADPLEDSIVNGQAWQSLNDAFLSAGKVVDDPNLPATPTQRAQGYRNLLRIIADAEKLSIEFSDPERPILTKIYDLGTKFAIDNPDTIYFTAPVLPDATYVIHGRPARLKRFADQQPPHFVSLGVLKVVGTSTQQVGSLNNGNGSLHTQRGSEYDGEFSAVVSATPPADGANWVQLEPGDHTQRVFIRETFNDWSREVPLRLSIERTDQLGAAPRLTASQLATQMTLMGATVASLASRWPQVAIQTRAQLGENVLPAVMDRPDITGLPGQLYSIGYYHVEDGQALLVEFPAPTGCFYWGAQAANLFAESLDYANHQTSVNGAQAYVDPDGTVRLVVARQDPGVANWIDVGEDDATGQGMIVLRFTECGQTSSFPAPQAKLRSIGELPGALPLRYPTISAGARAQSLAVRRQHLAIRLEE
jgi:hypothetical protein